VTTPDAPAELESYDGTFMDSLLERKSVGTLMMISTAALFSTMALFVRLASATIPTGMIVFTRYLLSTLFILVLFWTRVIQIRPVNRGLLFLRAISASFGGVFYFFAVSSITIPEAVILKYTYPLFAVTIAAVIYGEKTGRAVIALLILGLTGVVIMMNPASLHPQIGYVWGILNGICAGGAVAFVRKLRDTDDSGTIMFFTSLAGILVSMPFLSGGVVMPVGRGLVFMLLAAACGITAQFALVYGIRFIKTGSACVIMMLEVVISSVLGFLVLGHTIGAIQFIGGILILTGGTFLIIREG